VREGRELSFGGDFSPKGRESRSGKIVLSSFKKTPSPREEKGFPQPGKGRKIHLLREKSEKSISASKKKGIQLDRKESGGEKSGAENKLSKRDNFRREDGLSDQSLSGKKSPAGGKVVSQSIKELKRKKTLKT